MFASKSPRNVERETTVYSVLRNRLKLPQLSNEDLRNGVIALRSQEEEAYKIVASPIIAYAVSQLIVTSPKISISKQRDPLVAAFDASVAPEISVNDYLDRIIKYTPCSAECYILALLFLDRAIMSRSIRLTFLNVHRFLFTSIMISAKLLDDSTFNNKYYSIVGGIELQELNALERKMLILLNYNLNVAPETFECYRQEVEINVIALSFIDPDFPDEEPQHMTQHSSSSSSSPNVSRVHHGHPTLQRASSEISKSCSAEARENARILARQLRRSRSFNTANEGRLFKWRNRRSSSFNVVVLV